MTSGMGGYKYESTTTRALGSITVESYDYRDQGKVMSKLVTDVSYMAGLQRKMQKGIDDANQNFIQQIQSLITDFLVILGGGGDTGFDFGDLKYILQAIGAMFGLSPGMGLPINLFEAAWHFFSQYILPVGNFQEVIDMIIDNAIATALDIFGEVPIVGQAIQQLAVLISGIRDSLGPIIDALTALFDLFGGDLFTLDFGPFESLLNSLFKMFSFVTDPIADALQPVFAMISSWSEGFIVSLAQAAQLVASVIDILTGAFDMDPVGSFPHHFPFDFPDGTQIDVNNPLLVFFRNFLSFFNVGSWVNGTFNPLEAVKLFIERMIKQTNLLAWLDPITGLVPNFQAPQLLVDIIMTIEGAFLGIPIVGQIVKPVFDAINGLLGIGNNAQSTGNTGLSQVAQIWATINANGVTGGVQIVEDFNEASANSLNDRIEQTYYGPGGGTYGTDGKGRAIWRESGALSRGCFNRHKTKLATDFQQATLLLPKGLNNSPNGSPDVRIALRCDEARQNRVECQLKNDYNGNVFAEIGYYLGNTYTKLDAKGGQDNKDGDIYEFRAGNGQSGNEPWRYTILRNGLTILEVVDVLHNSTIGPNYRYPGWVVNTGARVFFYVTSQLAPADIEVFAAADRRVAA